MDRNIETHERFMILLHTRRTISAFRVVFTLLFLAILPVLSFSQVTTAPARSSSFRVGEKLTYSVSFQSFKNAAFLETYVVSRGKLSGKDVVEVRGRLKTFEIVSAAFSLIDEMRTVFTDPESGLPVFISRTQNDAVTPKETVSNFITTPTTNFDLLTVIYKLRDAGGNGSFSIFEDGETSIVTAQTSTGEKVKTDAGTFDTSVSTITGPYLDARGIKRFLVNFTSDDAHLPVLIRVKTAKGEYRAELSSILNPIPETTVSPMPTPAPVLTPKPVATPKPQATPLPYVENQPLLPELSFSLGETLEYKVTNSGTPVATLTLAAKERKLFQKQDSLALSATITAIEQANRTFALGDSVITQVNPDTLAPFQNEMKFGGALRSLNQTAIFDSRSGGITFGGTGSTESPIGTHSILSLIYAMRSFNLRPSKDAGNPVNDTRVAVFWTDRAYIFTLRPANIEEILFDGEKVKAQLITINTGNPQLDQLALKVWLSTDERRVPLRFSAGTFQADLTTVTKANLN